MTHVVIDNGAGHVKFGLLGHGVPALEVPNFKAEPRAQAGGKRIAAIGERKMDELRNGYIAHRPLQAGLLLDAATQLEIWQHGISAILPKYTTLADAHITFTETPATPPSVYAGFLELLFEQLGVASVAAVPTSLCNALAFPPNAAIARCRPGLPLEASPFPDQASQRPKYEYEVVLGGPPSDGLVLPDNEARLLVDVGFTGAVTTPSYRGAIIDSGCYRNYSGMHAVNLALQKIVGFKALNLGSYYHLVDRLRRKACFIEPAATLRDRVHELTRNCQSLQRDLRSYNAIFDGGRQPIDGESAFNKASPYVYDPRTEQPLQPPDLTLVANDQQLRELWQGKIILGPERVSLSRNVLDRGICIPACLWGGGYPKIGPHEPSVVVRPAAGVVGLATQSIYSSPPILQKSGFTERFSRDLRAALPCAWPLGVS